jgi:hypothetical protein
LLESESSAYWLVVVYPFPVVLVPVAEVVTSPVQLALKNPQPAVAEVDTNPTQVASKKMQKKLAMQQRLK